MNFVCVSAFAAPNSNGMLQLPLGARAAMVRKLGPENYQEFVKLMFNKSESMQNRWSALMTVAKVGGIDSVPELELALQDPEWFMRNAAILALSHIDTELAKTWARKLLSDKSLLVRSAAVRVLVHLNDQSSTALLWEKLSAPENFRKGHSLFIRKQIVQGLGRLEKPGQEIKFLGLLKNVDSTLHESTISALEQITNEKIGKPKDSLSTRRSKWIKRLALLSSK